MLVIDIKTNNYEYSEYYNGLFGKYVISFEILLLPTIVSNYNYFDYFEYNGYIIEENTISLYQISSWFKNKFKYNFYNKFFKIFIINFLKF